ncbi:MULTISPECIES: helix-turn-helix domain-containing protein [unclassified Clostridioides]|uniref:helix-turn-helix domain-containing protein n=1 Tax=unclassified Clostridioides TaxID=2635829 RepID=UPI001D106EE1|nr:helix-turn-helix domain-containing protein [Clostridioides sp. ES-W-0018-02]MCC0681097.1 helix-turn-helix domain-containing protein [Clostridioides sp. ES-S-0005-03]MCC0712785.1 helix-turn-helix domain-containing protein [Clostridioides sp. ES-W-0017-02]UDN47294.1 helix-turn-helix domain-containing protein [Clostridioides sp. ES-S-0173-01]
MKNLNIGELFNESIKTIILQEVKNAKQEIEKKTDREKIVILMQRGYPNELIPKEKVRKRLNIGKETLKDLIDLGLIPVIRNKRATKIASYDLDDFIEQSKGKDLSEVIEDAKSRKGVI